MPRLKHTHRFQPYAHYVGGMHGNVRHCECGARDFGGAMDDTLVTASWDRRRQEWYRHKLYGPRAPRGNSLAFLNGLQ